MTYIGIDASLRSTGITIKDNNKLSFYIITPKATKRQKESKDFSVIEYCAIKGDLTTTLHNYIDALRSLVKSKITAHYEEIIITLEDIPFMKGSRSVVDLAILNGYIRCLFHMLDIKIIVVNNMTWKKDLLGNAGGDKEFTTMNFKTLQPQFKSYSTKEINDIADSYFICHYAEMKEQG